MRKIFFLCTLFVVLVRPGSSTALADRSEWPPLRFVVVTDEGIVFFERTETGELEPLIEPLSNFAVETYGGSAEWMILSNKSFAVSPDGQHIAFTAQRGTEAALFLYIINDDSLIQHPIVSYWLLPMWSPDSEAILLNVGTPYWGGLPAPNDYVYEVATGSLSQITATEEIETVFQWSADGNNIVYLGWCNPDPCGNLTSDLYLVNRDGSSRFPLTDFPTQLPPNVDISACHLVWSPHDQRWYYEVGCGTFFDTPFTFIYSVDVNGNNRLEIDLEDYLRSTEGAGMTFQYASVRGIHPRPEGVYLSAQVSFYADPDLHPDMGDILLEEWRVLRLTGLGQLETIYKQPISSIGVGAAGLIRSVISPNGQRMVMQFNFDSAFVIVVPNNQNIGVVHGLIAPGAKAVCDVRWLDDYTVVYNAGGHTCAGADLTKPEAARLLNVTTGKVVTLTENLDGPAWVLPIPEVEILAQRPAP